MAKLNIGLIGVGRIGQRHARIIATQVEGAQLYAVAEPHPATREAFVAGFNPAPQHVFEDWQEMVNRPDVDAVVICTPTSLHHEHVAGVAAAGKPMLCEKPLALTVSNTQAAIAAARAARVPLQVGFMRRFDALQRRMREVIQSGAIGMPVMLKMSGRDNACPRTEFASPAVSGGLLIDMAIHDFDQARFLMGEEVVRVSAEGTLMVCENIRAVGDIDNAVVNLRFASGAIGNLDVSRTAFYGYDFPYEVLGSAGAVRVIGWPGPEFQVQVLSEAGVKRETFAMPDGRFADSYVAQMQDFVTRVVGAGEAPAVSGEDALKALQISLAARQSFESGAFVDLRQDGGHL